VQMILVTEYQGLLISSIKLCIMCIKSQTYVISKDIWLSYIGVLLINDRKSKNTRRRLF
jgi:hypothetical protein